MKTLEVYKFGGVAVGSTAAVRAALAHVRRARGPLTVVVSAMNGVTDLLLGAAASAVRGDRAAFAEASGEFEQRHLALVADLVTDRDRESRLRTMIAESSSELRSMTESIAVLRELTPRAQDNVVARGER